jgi:hypothetical protein
MDEATVRQHAEAHGDAVVRGDMDAVGADCTEQVRAQLPNVAKLFPRPTTAAEVVSVHMHDDHAHVEIRYSGDDKELTIRSMWEERDGRPTIVDAAPAD